MNESLSRPVFLDTTVVSNFASTNSLSVLDDVLEEVVVVASVQDELAEGVQHGHSYLEDAVTYVDAEFEIEEISPETVGAATVRDRLDRGEAAALLGALHADGTIATDDLAARHLAAKEGRRRHRFDRTPGTRNEREYVTTETADEWLDTWRRRRGY